jgi:hypothetical protein
MHEKITSFNLKSGLQHITLGIKYSTKKINSILSEAEMSIHTGNGTHISNSNKVFDSK